MPILLYVGMVTILLNIMNVLYISNKTDYETDKKKFDKEQYEEKLENIEKSLLTFYSNNYGDIHGDYTVSNFIKSMSNDKNPSEVYIFNNERFCKYSIPSEIEEILIEEAIYVPKILSKEEENQKINFDKNMICENVNNLYDTIVDLSEDDKKILEQIKKTVGDDFFVRIDIETIKPLRYLNLPVLNIYMYDRTVRHKPNLSSEKRLKTDIVVSNKIDESKLILNQVSNLLVEYGKRKFKGYANLNSYNGTNAFSNLAEAIKIENEDGTSSISLVSTNSLNGFQSTSVMAFPTHYLDVNSQSKIDDMVNIWSDMGNDPDCEFVNIGFEYDSTLNWYSNNSYYLCKFQETNNVWLSDNKIPKPEGYCSLNEYCALNFELNDKNKIQNITAYTLQEYLESDIGFTFNINNIKNPFFPNQSIVDNFNFILSSSSGNSVGKSQLSVNIGLRAVNRSIGRYDNDTINLFDLIDFEENYLINKYYISF